MPMTLAYYVENFERLRKFIMMPATQTITGDRYAAACWPDGSALIVGDCPAADIVYTTEHTGPNTLDLLGRAGALIAGLTQEERAAQLAALGPPHSAGRYILRGLAWMPDGTFSGIA